jgi:hypothetical protein
MKPFQEVSKMIPHATEHIKATMATLQFKEIAVI